MRTLLLLGLVGLVHCADVVFEADHEVIMNSLRVNIEEFYSTKNLTTIEDSRDAVLSTVLYTPDKSTPTEFYETTIKNLREHAPKLRTLSLYGGHTLYPESGSVEDVKKEIAYTKEHLEALLKALNKEKIALTNSVISILLVIDEKTQNESKIEKLIKKTFGKDAVVDDSNEDGLELLFRMEDADIHAYIVVINQLDAVKKTKLPYGRSSYSKSLTHYLEPIYAELEEQSKKRIHREEDKLFTPGVKRLNRAGDMHLEEFKDEKFADPLIKDTKPSSTLKQLVLSMGIPLPESEKDNAEEFYKIAVENLKKKAPSLKRVRLDGGYAYNPSKATADDIKSEVKYFKNILSAALLAFKNQKLNVTSLRLKLYWLASQKEAEASDYPKLLEDSFGFKPSKEDQDSGKILMHFKLHDVDCNVELSFYETAPKGLPEGRSSFYAAAKIHEEMQEEKEKLEEQKSKAAADEPKKSDDDSSADTSEE